MKGNNIRINKKTLLIGLIGFILIGALIGGYFITSKQKIQNSNINSSVQNSQAYQNIPKADVLTKEEIATGNFHELKLAISGMVCPYCAKGISDALLPMKGIIKTDITLDKRGGTVIYDSTKITKEEIINSDIFEGVYKAKIISDNVIR